MTLAACREAVVDMPIHPQHIEEASPQLTALFGRRESFTVADHDEPVACAGQKDVETFGSEHESDIMHRVAAGERDQDNLALLALIIVCYMMRVALYTWQLDLPIVASRMDFFASFAAPVDIKPARTRS